MTSDVSRPPRRRSACDPGQQLVVRERLADVVVGARREGGQPVLLAGQPGDEQEQGVGVGPDPLRQLGAHGLTPDAPSRAGRDRAGRSRPPARPRGSSRTPRRRSPQPAARDRRLPGEHVVVDDQDAGLVRHLTSAVEIAAGSRRGARRRESPHYRAPRPGDGVGAGATTGRLAGGRECGRPAGTHRRLHEQRLGPMAHRDRFDGEFESVLAAARTGSPRAHERIFHALAPVVQGYLRLQGASEPEDLTSEVFLAVLRNLGSFEGDEPGFRSWVFTIAHRRLLDERRRAVRRPAPAPLDEAPDQAGARRRRADRRRARWARRRSAPCASGCRTTSVTSCSCACSAA